MEDLQNFGNGEEVPLLGAMENEDGVVPAIVGGLRIIVKVIVSDVDPGCLELDAVVGKEEQVATCDDLKTSGRQMSGQGFPYSRWTFLVDVVTALEVGGAHGFQIRF